MASSVLQREGAPGEPERQTEERHAMVALLPDMGHRYYGIRAAHNELL